MSKAFSSIMVRSADAAAFLACRMRLHFTLWAAARAAARGLTAITAIISKPISKTLNTFRVCSSSYPSARPITNPTHAAQHLGTVLARGVVSVVRIGALYTTPLSLRRFHVARYWRSFIRAALQS